MFTLPELPYAYDALVPHIDARTMEIHHSKHHAWYTKKLNAALENTEYADWSIEKLLSNLDDLPTDIRQAVSNNWWGYYNHKLFWPSLSADGGTLSSGNLANAIDRDFWSFEEFQTQYTKKALTLFGSGWVYLCADADGSLSIKRCSFQETPLKSWLTPLLGLDVWEHAYYLHYQNMRATYVKNRWNIVNWSEVEKRYSN